MQGDEKQSWKQQLRDYNTVITQQSCSWQQTGRTHSSSCFPSHLQTKQKDPVLQSRHFIYSILLKIRHRFSWGAVHYSTRVPCLSSWPTAALSRPPGWPTNLSPAALLLVTQALIAAKCLTRGEKNEIKVALLVTALNAELRHLHIPHSHSRSMCETQVRQRGSFQLLRTWLWLAVVVQHHSARAVRCRSAALRNPPLANAYRGKKTKNNTALLSCELHPWEQHHGTGDSLPGG